MQVSVSKQNSLILPCGWGGTGWEQAEHYWQCLMWVKGNQTLLGCTLVKKLTPGNHIQPWHGNDQQLSDLSGVSL